MTYLLSFLLVLAVFAAMAVGLMLGGKPIRGSCGGLNCKLCEKPEDCVKRNGSKALPNRPL